MSRVGLLSVSLVVLSLACNEATYGLGSAGDEGGTATETGDGDGVETGDSAATGDGDPSTTGDGDGDPTSSGDGDGDPTTGDGDGDPSTGDGDGDGDPTTGDGDGDGDPTTGDGDGDTGDGDGDPEPNPFYGDCPNQQDDDCTGMDEFCVIPLLDEWQVCSSSCKDDNDCPMAADNHPLVCAAINLNALNKGCFLDCENNVDCPDLMSCQAVNVGIDHICVFK